MPDHLQNRPVLAGIGDKGYALALAFALFLAPSGPRLQNPHKGIDPEERVARASNHQRRALLGRFIPSPPTDIPPKKILRPRLRAQPLHQQVVHVV